MRYNCEDTTRMVRVRAADLKAQQSYDGNGESYRNSLWSTLWNKLLAQTQRLTLKVYLTIDKRVGKGGRE